MSADIVLMVGSVMLTGWTSYSVELDTAEPSGAWSVEVANPTKEQLALVEVGTPATLVTEGVSLLRGWLEDARVNQSRSGTTLTLSGRDLCAPLVDCVIRPPKSRPSSLAAAATWLVGEFGLRGAGPIASAEAMTAQAASAAHGDEPAWSWLRRGASAAGLDVWSVVGELYVGRLGAVPAVVAELGPAVPGVLSWSWSKSLAGRRSPLFVVGRGHTRAVVATVTDPTMAALFRPGTVELDDAPAQTGAATFAAAELRRARVEAEAVEVVVTGHGPTTGQGWRPDTFVRWSGPGAGIWWVEAVTFSRSNQQGTTTTLRLRAEAR